jgi:BlaI family penicillinase repressor
LAPSFKHYNMELTKAEEQILYYLWKLEEGSVQDILSCMEGERPSRTTVSTIIRILENKGAVGHKPTSGRSYIYFPLIRKEDYSRKQLFGFIGRYFDNSFSSLTSFFAKESNLSVDELDALMEEAKQKLEKGKKKE